GLRGPAPLLDALGGGAGAAPGLPRHPYGPPAPSPPPSSPPRRTGDLMSRATNDIQALRALAGFGAVMLVSTTFTFAGTLAAMWAIDPRLTIWALAPSPILVLLARRFNHRVEVESTALHEELRALSPTVHETPPGH